MIICVVCKEEKEREEGSTSWTCVECKKIQEEERQRKERWKSLSPEDKRAELKSRWMPKNERGKYMARRRTEPSRERILLEQKRYANMNPFIRKLLK